MSAIITRHIRPFLANQFLNAFNVTNYDVWVTSTAYSAGDIRVNGSYKYIATTSGTSGATPPTHTSGSASDGGVTWLFIEATAVTSFFENNLYVAIGNKDAWPSEPSPDAPLDDDASDYPNSAEIMAAKRLSGSSVSYAIVRYDWTSGMDVAQYNPEAPSYGYGYATAVAINSGGTGYTAADVVTVTLTNGTGLTVSIDTVSGGVATSISIVTEGIGLTGNLTAAAVTGGTGNDDLTIDVTVSTPPWYVYTDDNHIYKCLDSNDHTPSTSKPTGTSTTPFLTADGILWQYMATVSASDALQFLTSGYVPVVKKLSDDGSAQWDVQDNAKAGSLSTINVTDGGSGYTTATVTVAAAPAGGTTATATAVINGGVITNIQLTNIGEGYESVPSVSIAGDGSSATASAVMAPKDGNGSNILLECNARYAVIYARFDGTEGGYFPVTGENDFRRISLIVDPLDIAGDVATAARYIGPDHDDWDGSGTSGKEELMKGTGTTLYFENISPVVRASGQIEDIKIALKF